MESDPYIFVVVTARIMCRQVVNLDCTMEGEDCDGATSSVISASAGMTHVVYWRLAIELGEY